MKQRRKPISQRPIARILVIWVFTVVGLIVMALLLRGLSIDRLATAFTAAAVIGLLNALLWPFLSRILLPFAVFTGGLLFLVLNGVIIWLAAQFVEGIEVANVWTGTLTALGVTGVNVILSTLLTIDDDASYYRNVINKRIRKSKHVEETDLPCIFFLEIDGLAMRCWREPWNRAMLRR